MSGDPLARAAELAFWSGPVSPQPLEGGISNHNFLVEDGGRRYVVRVGKDKPLHGVMRFNEIAAQRAAHACGLAPELVHCEPGALVMAYVEGRTLAAEDVREATTLPRIVGLLRRVHTELSLQVRGPTLMFWVFHVNRDYLTTARAGGSRLRSALPRFATMNAELEQALGAVQPVFGHNDLLAANFIDDGQRLWLLDWEYAGWNSPLFDLANLASNNALSAAQEETLLTGYFQSSTSPALWRQFRAMQCASLLRETLWSVVQELHSRLEFDYAQYTAENLARLERAYATFQETT
jgi:thiamine kinase-like enzyme